MTDSLSRIDMASAEQIKALLKSHIDGEDDRFFSIAMQVAAHEARLGHGKLAEELRAIIDDAKERRGAGSGDGHPDDARGAQEHRREVWIRGVHACS